nr:hypothetical protein [Tanacetum cinerariifolium]
ILSQLDQYLQEPYKNHRIQLLPIEHNAQVEDIVEFETAIAQTFLYLRQFLPHSSANSWQWDLHSSGSGNTLHWQWELILPVGTLSWQLECLFKLLNVWTLVDLPHGKRAIRTKWVFRNKKDQRGFVVRNKSRLVAQGHRQEEGIDYDEVFAVAARIERRFMLANPLGFVDLEFPDKVYKVEKALYGLHQAPRAWLDIMFAVCACSRFQVQQKVSHIDYAGASLNRKSTTGGCQFLGSRLISWQCKKQTIMVNSTTKAENIATSNYCGQVL